MMVTKTITLAAFLPVLILTLSRFVKTDINEDEEVRAIEFLNRHNSTAEGVYYITTEAAWTYNTNITDYNQEKMIEESLIASEFEKQAQLDASVFNTTVLSNDTVRQLEKILDIGASALNATELEEYNQVLADMETTYSTGKVCDHPDYPDQCLPLDPDLTKIMATSRDYNELLYAWEGWRNVTGPYMREDYTEFVELANEAAKLNGQPDNGAYWRSWYEVDDLKGDVLKLWDQLQPLYLNLHAYVRRKLSQVYGQEWVDLEGPIPAHLLGNMWAQSWGNIWDLCEPFPGKQQVDVTDAMIEQGYDAQKMFELSDEFFTSLGLIEMPQEFWDKSLIEKPTDGREVVCHASAWDFSNRKDFRIKQCTVVTQEDLVTVHHEMGHIEYYLQYAGQPVIYRGGANPGFHEAVGDVLALSVNTPKHLKEIGLLDKVTDDPEADLNFLMTMALEKIAFLPFGLLMDLWRWDVFSGVIPPEKYNEGWWDYRTKIQGVSPPAMRDENDFDPGAKFHIPANTPYIRYFVSFVIQFQFHKSLCQAAGQYDPTDAKANPLYKCDIYKSQEAGSLLSEMLMLGTSEKWPVAMEKVTGQREMDASAIIEYFDPLISWLEAQNFLNGDRIGWNSTWTPPFNKPWVAPTSIPTEADPTEADPTKQPEKAIISSHSSLIVTLALLLLTVIFVH